MLYIRYGKHWSCDHKSLSERKYIAKKTLAYDNTGLIEISFYNDAADRISGGKCFRISNLTLNTYKSERILKSSARTEVTLLESHHIVVPEMTQTLEKEMKGKFISADLKSLTPINICSTCKTVLTEEMINYGVVECASCNMISTDYNSLTKWIPSENQFKSKPHSY